MMIRMALRVIYRAQSACVGEVVTQKVDATSRRYVRPLAIASSLPLVLIQYSSEYLVPIPWES